MREVTDRAFALAQRAGTAHLARGRRMTPFGADRSVVPEAELDAGRDDIAV
jgi:hypothetical protein